MPHRIVFLVSITLVLLLVSCVGPASQPTETQVAKPTHRFPPTATLTEEPTESPTPSPSAVPPSPTPSPGEVVDITPSLTPDTVGTIVAAREPDVIQSHTSPDGKWRVDVVTYPCDEERASAEQEEKLEQLILIDLRTGTETVIQSQILTCGSALGAAGLGGLFWSPDSQIFYYTDAREGVPDGGGGLCWDWRLWALRVNETTIERRADIWARSRSGDRLAIARDGEQIIVETLGGERISSAPTPPNLEVCEIAWSPNGETFVYLRPHNLYEPSTWELICVDAERGTSTSMYELGNAVGVTMTWESPGEIILSGTQNGKRVEWSVEQSCSGDELTLPESYDPSEEVPADVTAWDTHPLRYIDVTLPVPPDWEVRESGEMGDLLYSVSFRPPLWDSPGECGYQCPGISAAIYRDTVISTLPPIDALREWFDRRYTPQAFETDVENDAVAFFGVERLEETTMGGRPALGFYHEAMGIRLYTVLTVVDGTVVGLGKSHVGRFEFEPVFETMRTHAVFGEDKDHVGEEPP